MMCLSIGTPVALQRPRSIGSRADSCPTNCRSRPEPSTCVTGIWAFLGANRVDLHHERHIVHLKPIGYRFAQYRGANRRNDSVAILRLRMFFMSARRITQDTPVSERAQSPFHTALKPSHHLAVGNRCRQTAQRVLVFDPLHVWSLRQSPPLSPSSAPICSLENCGPQ